MHSQYLGGQSENYESIVSNKGGGPWSAGLPYDGTGAHWNTLLTKRSDWQGIQPYLDTAQFLDFMLLFMSGDSEAEQRCVSPNTPGSGYKFYLNDADGWTRTPPDRTLNEGPDNIMQMLRAEAHPDYKATLADRIQRHFFNNGAMTAAKLLARHDARASELETPFVLEAAPLGISHRGFMGCGQKQLSQFHSSQSRRHYDFPVSLIRAVACNLRPGAQSAWRQCFGWSRSNHGRHHWHHLLHHGPTLTPACLAVPFPLLPDPTNPLHPLKR